MGEQIFSRIALGIYYFLWAINGALFLRIILSWFMDPFSRVLQTLVSLTEPFVSPVRALLMRVMGGNMRMDFSVILTSLVIRLLQRLVIIFM